MVCNRQGGYEYRWILRHRRPYRGWSKLDHVYSIQPRPWGVPYTHRVACAEFNRRSAVLSILFPNSGERNWTPGTWRWRGRIHTESLQGILVSQYLQASDW